jgi:hypothetical protein
VRCDEERSARGSGRKEREMRNGQLTLGELIEKLEKIVAKSDDSEMTVRFDFEYLAPLKFTSWRGAYKELAINWSEENDITAVCFLKICKEAIGGQFDGYKGGLYIMGNNTPIWVANSHNVGNTALIDVEDKGYIVILHTAWREY